MTARILMVDDEPDAQELFRQHFRREVRKGLYSFDFALSGEAALELLKGAEPPKVVLVLSDINMPGMSGIELLAEIRRTWPEVGVFMITAYGDKATEQKAHDLGAHRFLTKPVDFARLKRDLAEMLNEGGAGVDNVAIYTAAEVKIDTSSLVEALGDGTIDWVTFASPSSADAFFGQIPVGALNSSRA